MARYVMKVANQKSRMWQAPRKWSNREGPVTVTPALKRRQHGEERTQEHDTSDENEEDQGKSKQEQEEEDEEAEEEGNGVEDCIPTLIDVGHSWRAVTTDVYAAVQEHRELVMERQLTLPVEHPRATLHGGSDFIHGSVEAQRRPHSGSIE